MTLRAHVFPDGTITLLRDRRGDGEEDEWALDQAESAALRQAFGAPPPRPPRGSPCVGHDGQACAEPATELLDGTPLCQPHFAIRKLQLVQRAMRDGLQRPRGGA